MILPVPMTFVCSLSEWLYDTTDAYDICAFQGGYLILPVPMSLVCFRVVI